MVKAHVIPLTRVPAARALLANNQVCAGAGPYPCYATYCQATPAEDVCSYRDAYAIRAALIRANLAPLYWDATFDNAQESFKTDPKSHFQDAFTYVQNYQTHLQEGRNIVLRGDVGKGKTYLSMCIANALLDRQVDVLALGALRIGSLFHTFRERGGGSLDAFRRRLYSVSFLFFDEWMTQYNDDWVAKEFQAVIYERTNRKKPIIATTNLTQKNIVETAGLPEFKPSIDRLFDKSFEWALTVARDYRAASGKLTKPVA